MASSSLSHQRTIKHDDPEPPPNHDNGLQNDFFDRNENSVKVSEGTSSETIVDICPEPPQIEDMDQIQDKKSIFMILPFKYDPSRPDREPKVIKDGKEYVDRWDENHVRMPCSPNYTFRNKESMWRVICQQLLYLKQKCDKKTATFEDLKAAIENCAEHNYDMYCLEVLINKIYSKIERAHFMSTVLSNICLLALTVHTICVRPPPLLRIDSNKSGTMSQRQAASLLACAFFCLFPYRFDHEQIDEYRNFQNPNFNKLYQRGPPEKIEKLKCILHYFERITEKMPTGVITFRRVALPYKDYPKWSDSRTKLCDIHLTTSKKIEDVNSVLQVDFANKYIGGGVLGSGCVQEEIRFSICPEMLVSLLLCERMETNECVFLIGCERYSEYKGYAGSFEFAGNYEDSTPKDNWGRKWCHLVAMDAICFHDRAVQFEMKYVNRELIKAYTSFRPWETKIRAEHLFGIVTGNWGCGVFNGDRQLKAIIQLMAASEAGRTLIYAAYMDKNLVNSFAEVYEFLISKKTTVGDLYRYLEKYSTQNTWGSIFEYILNTPISSKNS